jgi:hypothetical protein
MQIRLRITAEESLAENKETELKPSKRPRVARFSFGCKTSRRREGI